MFGRKSREIKDLNAILLSERDGRSRMDGLRQEEITDLTRKLNESANRVVSLSAELDQTAKWLFEANEKIQPLIAERDQLHRRVEELEAEAAEWHNNFEAGVTKKLDKDSTSL